MKVAIQGIKGSYHHQVAIEFFSDDIEIDDKQNDYIELEDKNCQTIKNIQIYKKQIKFLKNLIHHHFKYINVFS